jgi:leader peptidase (prepilin peptidase)/N-methyltransferase
LLLAIQDNTDNLLLIAALYEHIPPAIFVFILGACVGSFLNVVIYRLPNNIRLLVPASSCPSCNHKLRFFRENVPIIGWLAIRGKCRYCKAPVSMEYPIVELVTALLFLACYAVCYWIPESTPFLGEIFGPWWHDNGVIKTLPMFLSLLTLVAGLLAMTIIDARTFMIPIQIPLFMTAVGFLAALLQPHLNMRHLPEQVWPYPLVDWTWAGAAFGGMIGVCVSTFFLKIGVFRCSFADYDDYIQGDEMLAVYPHARREVLRELVFVLPIVVGFIVGWMCGYETGYPSLAVQGIAGSMLGYIVGGAFVWGIRIFGSLAFGKEAMGLGDVHLLAGVGAIIGWWDPILIFFIAPFSGILWAIVAALLEKIGKQHQEIPYGPHLAVATLVVVFANPGIHWLWSVAMPGVHMPTTEKLQTKLLEVDLTYGEKQGSIPIYPHVVGNDKAIQDVSLVCGFKSSDMEKGHA